METADRRACGRLAGVVRFWVTVALVGVAGSGCAVGQRPGRGWCERLQEGTTGAEYWLYLPAGYGEVEGMGKPERKYPLVMTFHGMKPFDTARSQIREWQQEADRYGFVVCAPLLTVADVSGPLPLSRRNHPSLRRDEKAIIAIMNELYRIVDVDPNRVLSTSWSYGGYVAHYMANAYPERFSCIAVRQSNFNENLLDPATVPRYRDRKVAIYYTENDFAICKRESRQAAAWYARHGFDLTYGVFEKKGHERTPGVAAEFFARTCGVEAKTAPVELARMQIKSEQVYGQPGGAARATIERTEARATGRRRDSVTSDVSGGLSTAPPRRGRPGEAVEVASARSPFLRVEGSPTAGGGERGGGAIVPQRDIPSGMTGRGVTLRSRPALPEAADGSKAGVLGRLMSATAGPVRIRLSATIGVAPLLVTYSAVMPKKIREDAHLLWTDNGVPVSNGLHGQRVFSVPGDHALEVLVTANDGTEYRASRTITVIGRASRKKP